ncbi:uncharacterized protein KGF55_003750 [Candida pseudojiufengensis]|uniref:uncharacterized protein n=1 Tax=Candida pseudojiufengensis TaxID=497109 RepID=UPI0022253B5B|nr:uncharacterized protein KGF55_003750 [Candida pseudojiufengensis]KAI5962674.1 hypothetical protein KGF55_003750 [Candida pseudojiufengensis]
MKAVSPSYSNSSKISKSSSESLESQPISSGTEYTIEEDKYSSSSSCNDNNNKFDNFKNLKTNNHKSTKNYFHDEESVKTNMNNQANSTKTYGKTNQHIKSSCKQSHKTQFDQKIEHDTNDLINSLNEFVFTESNSNDLSYCNFPVILKIQVDSKAFEEDIRDLISQYPKLTISEEIINTIKYLIVKFKTKSNLDDLIYRLYDENIPCELDYSKFVSHPGILFIKNLSSEIMFEMEPNSLNNSTEFLTVTPKSIYKSTNCQQHKLYEFLIDNCHFKSLQELKIFSNQDSNTTKTNTGVKSPNSTNSNPLSSAFAIVKFSNYLDVDILIEKFNRHTPNIFNENHSVPLFLNKYLNKRERSSPFGNKGIIQSSNNNIQTNLLSRSSLNSNNLVKNSSNENFNLIILENLNSFLKIDENVNDNDSNLVKFNEFLNVFQKFGNSIESIYFPIVQNNLDHNNSNNGESSILKSFKFFDFGYIKFKPNQNLMENTLRVLYYLNDLKWDDFMSLDVNNLPSLMDECEFESTKSNENSQNAIEKQVSSNNDNKENSPESIINNKLSITIAQHKHNHYLFNQANQFYLSYNNEFSNHFPILKPKQNSTSNSQQQHHQNVIVNYPNPIYTINTFVKNLNYQETNIYVNNFSIVFANDDLNWEKFWKQFGSIKSAKIIKPQFYNQQQQQQQQQGQDELNNKEVGASHDKSNYNFTQSSQTNDEYLTSSKELSEAPENDTFEEEQDQKSGRIGFIFYENFKQAIRAILMTNNKMIHIENFNPMIIQSSFAIQKSSNSNNNGNNIYPIGQHGLNQFGFPFNNGATVVHPNNKFNTPMGYHQLNPHPQPPLPHHLANQNHYLKYNNYYNNNSLHKQPINTSHPSPCETPPTSTKVSTTATNNGYNNSVYYTYQPVYPFYYGYHPSPYQYGTTSTNPVLNNYMVANNNDHNISSSLNSTPKKINTNLKENKEVKGKSSTARNGGERNKSHHPAFTNYLLNAGHNQAAANVNGYVPL